MHGAQPISWLSSANQLSTRFSHEARVGDEVRMKAEMTSQPEMHQRGFVGCVVVQDQVSIQGGGHSPSMRSRNTRNSTERWSAYRSSTTRQLFISKTAHSEFTACGWKRPPRTRE